MDNMSLKTMIDILFASDPCLAIEKFQDLLDDDQLWLIVEKKLLHRTLSIMRNLGNSLKA